MPSEPGAAGGRVSLAQEGPAGGPRVKARCDSRPWAHAKQVGCGGSRRAEQAWRRQDHPPVGEGSGQRGASGTGPRSRCPAPWPAEEPEAQNALLICPHVLGCFSTSPYPEG